MSTALAQVWRFAVSEAIIRVSNYNGGIMPGLIESSPQVMMGKPVVAGTRITVEEILGRLGAGETTEALLEAHPRLTRESVQAALAFAAEVLKSDVIYPSPNEAA